MNQEWYYENGGSRHGPVSPAVLKQRADSGQVGPETLVWRQGMSQWVQAKAVKGLFPNGSTAAPLGPPAPAPVSTNAPLRRLPISFNVGDWHPLDIVVAAARQACPSDLAATISKSAGQTGTLTLYLAAVLVPIGGALFSIKAQTIAPLAFSLAIGLAILIVQYVAQRLLRACDTAIRANRSTLSSLAVPDCLFVLTVASTAGGTLGLVWFAIKEGEIRSFIAGIAVLAVGTFAAMVAIQPSGVSVDVDADCRMGEEAVGVLKFLMKFSLRCVPIAFAAAVTLTTLNTASFLLEIIRSDQDMLGFMAIRASTSLATLFAAAGIPLYAYLVMLLYYLTLDVISAIVSIPGKLDVIADHGKGNPPTP